MVKKIVFEEKFGLFDEFWTPKVVGEVNDSVIKIFKAKGEFVWHQHDAEDEFFLVMKGELRIKLRDKEVVLKAGEGFVVPMGVEHMPYAVEEAHVVLFEKKSVVNTGDAVSERTVDSPEWI